jgi:hypothetical protein
LIDYIKLLLTCIDYEVLEASPYLDFHSRVNEKTGEVGTYKNAYFKGLEFKIYEPTETNPINRITVEGSLHKYWNNGAHNFNDFGVQELNLVLSDLKKKFNIEPKNSILRSLEIGVNIKHPYITKDLLECCLLHKTKQFKWIYTSDEGNYIQVRHQRYFIKIYDKQKHYTNKGFKIDNEILRFEIKYSKLYDLQQLGIYTLEDLLNYDLKNFKTILIKEWNNILFYDTKVFKKTKYEYKYSNAVYWLNLNKGLFKYHRNNLKNIVVKHKENIKKEIAELIQDKCDILNTETILNNPLYIGLIKEVDTTKDNDLNRRFCIITKLNISMQKQGSILLSHTGIKYYYKTDKKIYYEIKNRYLSKKWIDADYKTQIKEIAHNIRTTHSNTKAKQRLLYKPAQLRLF